ncbi:MAG: type II toxin-antitoxin system VapC family toxin [Gaiellaceae bacterium]
MSAYADSSALAKLLVLEPESAALTDSLGDSAVLTSEIAGTELLRVALRTGLAEALPHAERLLARLALVALTPALLRAAGVIRPPELRSLDAIHLATALSIADQVDRFVCYDRRLAQAAATAGLVVVAPS